MSRVVDVFLACASAIERGVLIRRASRQDKEFHFQNWFRDRLKDLSVNFEEGGRNSYPDFRLVVPAEGYEVKGLAYPGREADYDCNSQVPTGHHNGRTVYYVFGRYPSDAEEDTYPVWDLVLCHGDFLNAHHEYVHKNKNIRGFGSYGDIKIRDRKMYIAPTPFALTEGTVRNATLILPEGHGVDERLASVGSLVRVETSNLVVGYAFDLRTNSLVPTYAPNPGDGKQHRFTAFRHTGTVGPSVTLAPVRGGKGVEDEREDESPA